MLRPALLVFSGLLYLSCIKINPSEAIPHCEACGMVCVNFCNTRDFRPCCINYMRKRSSPPLQQPPPSRPQLADSAAGGQREVVEQRPWLSRSKQAWSSAGSPGSAFLRQPVPEFILDAVGNLEETDV
ncbi:uncharacterized protein LOC132202374 [Neocloeon triangulifer]|uniref:uncharacterized protein LOC132202374 n=1 Tax=Neocloeon triangulifer TaxID=2078957 RepID=UPI00286F90D9|nr:uncharacterized protein LOC132202374 [Neocloeon triangulifer]